MSKSIVVITSSSRKNSNSAALADALIEGVRAAGNEAVKFNAGAMEIRPCRGCEYCHQHDGICVQKDDMQQILTALRTADAVVFASPVYFYNICGQLKNVIDRTYCLYPEVNYTKAALLATAADGRPLTFDTPLASYHSYLACLKNTADAGTVFCGGVMETGAVPEEKKEQARELGKSL